MTPAADAVARERVQRVMYTACGIGAMVFGLLLLSGASGILASLDQLDPWYGCIAVVVGVMGPASFAVTGYLLPIRVLHAVAVACIGAFLLMQVLWIPGMTNDVLRDGATPWIQGVNALPATLAGVAWGSSWALAFPLSQLALVPLIQLKASDTDVWAATLDGSGALIFCSILVAMALAVVGAADREDRAARQARTVAALEAAQRTRERERSRIDAIVHDDVMSVLLMAARGGHTPGLAQGAREAILSIHQISQPDTLRDNGYGPAEVVAALRAVPAGLGATVDLDYSFGSGPPIPGAAVAAISEALGEAVRNAIRHAGPDAPIAVTISVDAQGVEVLVTDHGRGFDVTRVDPSRLGIQVSIRDRMAAVAGGSAMIWSRKGHGTTVALRWGPP